MQNEKKPGYILGKILVSVIVVDIAALSIALTIKLIQWMLF